MNLSAASSWATLHVVFDVKPKREAMESSDGRIWAEDQTYYIVRFNEPIPPTVPKGRSTSTAAREHGSQPLVPSYVYTEDPPWVCRRKKLSFKAQTRLWGINVGREKQGKKLTSLIVEYRPVPTIRQPRPHPRRRTAEWEPSRRQYYSAARKASSLPLRR